MNIRLSVDKDGLKVSFIFLLIAVIGGSISSTLGWLGAISFVACLAFFRDPERVQPRNINAVTSPADGTILKISETPCPDDLGFGSESLRKISIFMSVFNVHVNRSPISGIVKKITYIPGRFFNVTLDKACEHNERQATCVKRDDGVEIIFVQIAGLIARRIRSDINEGDRLERGQRVGIIRFGSRVDVYLPLSAQILVEEGQTTVAGETILADFPEGV